LYVIEASGSIIKVLLSNKTVCFPLLYKMQQKLPPPEGHAETDCPVPRSASTIFDESIFGPLLRKELNTADHSSHINLRDTDPMLQSQKDSGKPQSTFEQMMLSFEEDGCKKSPKVKLKAEDTSARHMEWRNFISGRDFSYEVQLGTAELPDSRPKVRLIHGIKALLWHTLALCSFL